VLPHIVQCREGQIRGGGGRGGGRGKKGEPAHTPFRFFDSFTRHTAQKERREKKGGKKKGGGGKRKDDIQSLSRWLTSVRLKQPGL